MKFVYLLAFAAVVTVTNSQSEDIDCPAWNLLYTKFRYPHPTNCKMYYSCVFGTPYLRSCPKLHGIDLYYDPKLQTCNWSWKVDCSGVTTTTPDVITTGSSITNDSSTPSVSCDPTKSVCPSSGSCNMKHETDCKAYYECKDGQKMVACCPENRFFNPIVHECDLIPPPCTKFPVCS